MYFNFSSEIDVLSLFFFFQFRLSGVLLAVLLDVNTEDVRKANHLRPV